jgi:16S rRNA processing protein RimM
VSARAQTPKTQLRVGRLTKAHGLKGAIKIELYTDDPDRRFAPGATFSLQVPTSSSWHGKLLTLRELRYYNGSPVAFFEDVSDRDSAESLLKAILWIDLATDEPQEEDAWFDHQLVGLTVLRDGAPVGTLARLEHLPAQDLLVVATDDGEVLVPFVKAIVSAVDLTAGTVTVTPPVGLFEELPDEDPAPVEAGELADAAPSDAATEDAAAEDLAPDTTAPEDTTR